MKKLFIASCSIIMSAVLLSADISSVNAAPFSGKAIYAGSWTEKSGFLWLNTDTYGYTATYKSSFITMLDNLSGTKYWDNYKNKKKTAQKMKIGISQSITVSKTTAWTISGKVGLSVPLKAADVSGQIGGSYTNSKKYSKTVGTSSAYTISTESKNGYYAITHAINCDCYDVSIKKNNSAYSSGKMIRYASVNGYERLWYSANSF